jgi:hypothetical protein
MGTTIANKPGGSPSTRKPRRWPWVVGGVVILTAGWWLFTEDTRQLNKVRAMQEELRKEMFTSDGMPDPAKMLANREKFEAVRKEAEQLPESQKEKLREERGNGFQQMIAKRIADYKALPAGPPGKFSPEQLKFLNAEIDRMESMRNMFANMRPPGGGGGGPGGPGGPGAGPPPGGPGAGGPGGPPPGSNDPQKQDERRRGWLDRIPPDMRAEMSRMMADMNEVRRMRGMPPMQFGRPPGGGPPPGTPAPPTNGKR